MTGKQYVCIRCNLPKGCTFSPGGNRLPAICGWDDQGRMITPEWLEVPDTKTMEWEIK